MNNYSLFFLFTILTTAYVEGNMKLISPAFNHNEAIPAKYTCNGTNISPALQWTDAPHGTQGFALIVDDPDAPSKVWVHWVLFNIPASENNLPENVASGSFVQGSTDFNDKQGYGGPCPPSGTHRYQFTLYALDKILDLTAGSSKEEILAAMKGHILAQTTLIGLYKHQD